MDGNGHEIIPLMENSPAATVSSPEMDRHNNGNFVKYFLR